MNYYNEHDPKAAAWLRELISAGLIPNGDVDERSITEVQPDDLRQYTQCHFFAGIGGWSLALQLAGWPADKPVWTGSCPCQPFSTAGKGLGDKDERHLWPLFFNLIKECKPDAVFGEQVASAIGKGWLDGVSSDLESENYACGSIVLGAHSVGAPHIRQRLYWVADSNSGRFQQRDKGIGSVSEFSEVSPIRPTGFWDQYDIIPCRDGKSRRIECQSRGLADGIPTLVDALRDAGATEEQIEAAINPFPLVKKQLGRTILLKGYGNAIVPQVAAEFIKAFLES